MTDFGKFFTREEFVCSHTGEEKMSQDFLDCLNKLRELYGQPMLISSGYRHETHPVEARKKKAGMHTTGLACDVLVHGKDAHCLLEHAMSMQLFTGIGIAQKGAITSRFIHLDIGQGETRPWVWSY